MITSFSQPLRIVQTIVLALLVCTIGFGCRDSAESKNETKNQKKSVQEEAKSAELLTNALDMLRPERLRISADTATAVGLINQWSTKLTSNDVNYEISDETRKLLDDESASRVENRLYGARDAQHLRNCFYYKKASDFAASFAESELDQIVDVFYYVVRNVDLMVDTGDSIPISPFGVGLFGRGTPKQRAWLFANLLRQLRVDAVIVSPATKSDNNEEKWLIAAISDGKAYLFDTRLGLPIPEKSEDATSPIIRRPATLSDVIQNDELLRQLDLTDRPYPLKADDLKNIRVSAIGNSCFWSPRMQLIQGQLSGDLSVVAFDGFEDTKNGKGLRSRVEAFISGLTTNAKLDLWTFPEQQLRSYANLNESQTNRLRVRSNPLDAPRSIVSARQVVNLTDQKGGIVQGFVVGGDDTTLEIQIGRSKMAVPASQIPRNQIKLKIMFGPPRRQLMKTRVQQILGKYSLATTQYVPIRLWNRLPPSTKGMRIPEKDKALYEANIPSDIRTMHHKAAENALFWMGTCQFEKQDFAAATDTLNLYLERYKTGAWVAATRYLLALTHLKSDRVADAIKSLEAIEDTAAQQDGYDIMLQRWNSIANASSAAGE